MKLQIFYGVWMCAVNALWFMVVAILFSRPMVRNKFLTAGNKFEKFMGAVLIILAVKLLFANI